MKKPTRKQVIGGALFAASFIPAVRIGRTALAVGKVAARTTVGKKAVKKIAEHGLQRKYDIQDAYDSAQRALRNKRK